MKYNIAEKEPVMPHRELILDVWLEASPSGLFLCAKRDHGPGYHLLRLSEGGSLVLSRHAGAELHLYTDADGQLIPM